MDTTQQLSKKERRELRRQERVGEQTRVARSRQGMRFLWWALAAVIIIGIIGIAVWSSRRPSASVHEWVRGNEDAPVTLVEYADFQCPACAAYLPLVEKLRADFPESLRLVFRHYPLVGTHEHAMNAALAAEAAGKQGKFWEMHDQLYSEQRNWSQADNVLSLFEQYARDLGLDTDKFQADMNGTSLRAKVNADQHQGNSDNVQGTPTFILNGRRIANPASYEAFKTLIQAELDAAVVADDSADELQPTIVHEHADIAVFVDGQKLDLGQTKYQSHGHDRDGNEVGEDKHPYLHLHDGNGEILHKHARGYALAEFFQSIGITLTNECLTLDTGERYCASDNERLSGMVNGQPVVDIAGYEFEDLDRLLISFGSAAEVAGQSNQVTDKACIYSEKCPERGSAPAENCVGGLGTSCE